MPCNSGSKGGCWAPYTCWMLGKQRNRKLVLSPPSKPNTESRKVPAPQPHAQPPRVKDQSSDEWCHTDPHPRNRTDIGAHPECRKHGFPEASLQGTSGAPPRSLGTPGSLSHCSQMCITSRPRPCKATSLGIPTRRCSDYPNKNQNSAKM